MQISIFWRQAVSWLGDHGAKLRLSVRITIAGLLAYGAAHLLGLAQGYWAVFTAVIVMQASVGGALKAGVDRLIGTLGGAVWGVAVAAAIPHDTVVSTGVALAAALVPLAVLVAFRPAYRVAPVTAVIVLLGTVGQTASPLYAAGERVLAITLGSAIALGVALFVLPARAQRLLLEAAGNVLALMAGQMKLLLGGSAAGPDKVAIQSLNERLRRALGRAETLVEEAERERASRLTDAPNPAPLLGALRRLRYDLAMVARATAEPFSAVLQERLTGPAQQVSAAIAGFLGEARAALTAGKPAPALDAVRKALADYDAAMAALRSEGGRRDLPTESVGRVFGLAFALEQFRRDLEDLAARIDEQTR